MIKNKINKGGLVGICLLSVGYLGYSNTISKGLLECPENPSLVTNPRYTDEVKKIFGIPFSTYRTIFGYNEGEEYTLTTNNIRGGIIIKWKY